MWFIYMHVNHSNPVYALRSQDSRYLGDIVGWGKAQRLLRGTGNVLFPDLGTTYLNVFTFWQFVILNPCAFCVYIMLQNIL